MTSGTWHYRRQSAFLQLPCIYFVSLASYPIYLNFLSYLPSYAIYLCIYLSTFA